MLGRNPESKNWSCRRIVNVRFNRDPATAYSGKSFNVTIAQSPAIAVRATTSNSSNGSAI
jgi:hypothetical protein